MSLELIPDQVKSSLRSISSSSELHHVLVLFFRLLTLNPAVALELMTYFDVRHGRLCRWDPKHDRSDCSSLGKTEVEIKSYTSDHHRSERCKTSADRGRVPPPRNVPRCDVPRLRWGCLPMWEDEKVEHNWGISCCALHCKVCFVNTLSLVSSTKRKQNDVFE